MSREWGSRPMRLLLLGLLSVVGLSSVATAEDSKTPVFDAYFTVFEGGSADNLPLTDDVMFDGSLLPEPIAGRDAVVLFLNRVVPSLGIMSIDVKQIFETRDGACAELVFNYETLGQVEYAHCLEIAGGEISAIRLYFDPRPFLDEQP